MIITKLDRISISAPKRAQMNAGINDRNYNTLQWNASLLESVNKVGGIKTYKPLFEPRKYLN